MTEIFLCTCPSFIVMGLQCYRCVSNKSKEDCASHAVKTTCPSDLANAVCAEGDILIESGAISSHIFLKGKSFAL